MPTFAELALASSDQVGVAAEASALTAMALATGGDMRIWPNPVGGRNTYGTLTAPAPKEISFASTTANNVSNSGFAAADKALTRLLGSGTGPGPWFDHIRSQIVYHLGLPGAGAVLAASGTDAELLALGLCTGLSRRLITNIFIAPDETGNGIPLAAGGRHFSNVTALGEMVRPGEPIEGFGSNRIDVQTIALRDDAGRPRDAQAIDDDAVVMVERALRRDRDVLLHVLDASKTGLRGLTRSTARSLAAQNPGRVRVVIDACQLRSPLADLKRDLSDGFMVTVTGSKFAGGPPFSGALLLPVALIDEIKAQGALPEGLGGYSAALDWPDRLRDDLGINFKFQANVGLGLRWIAALDNIARYAALAHVDPAPIYDRFVGEVRSRALRVPGISLHLYDEPKAADPSSIVALTVTHPDGSFASTADAQRLQFALRARSAGVVCHIGQAVRVGPRTVLRAALSARDVSAVAERLAFGQSLDDAFKPIATDLDTMFEKWSRIAGHA